MQMKRSTIRSRLTVFYALVFALCGITLALVSYLLVSHSLRNNEKEGATRKVMDNYGYTQQQVDFFNALPVPKPSTNRQAKTIDDVLTGLRHDINDDVLHT